MRYIFFIFTVNNFNIKLQKLQITYKKFKTKALIVVQISGKTIGDVKIVADMHQRKSEMSKHADAFIALPGTFFLCASSTFNTISITK